MSFQEVSVCSRCYPSFVHRNARRALVGLAALAVWVACKPMPQETESLSQGGLGKNASLNQLIAATAPVVVAHGKNVNIAEESTWKNLAFSVKNGAQILEFDVQMLQPEQVGNDSLGEFIVFHDPTPHRLVKNYTTPKEKEAEFVRRFPDLAAAKRGQSDFYLFDRMSSFTVSSAKKTIWIHDEKSNSEYAPIFLNDILAATNEPGVFSIPNHERRTAEGLRQLALGGKIALHKPLFFYLDLKDINPLARKLNNLSSWDWQMMALPTDQLVNHARQVVRSLSRTLNRYQAHDRVFLTVRHEEIARIVRETDPRIKIMASTENVNADSPIQDYLSNMRKFAIYRPEFVEVKYLNHIVKPELHEEARKQKWQVFYNEIVQTDKSQFEGKYQNNLPLLVRDILAPSPDVFIQTNTVAELVSLVKQMGR